MNWFYVCMDVFMWWVECTLLSLLDNTQRHRHSPLQLTVRSRFLFYTDKEFQQSLHKWWIIIKFEVVSDKKAVFVWWIVLCLPVLSLRRMTCIRATNFDFNHTTPPFLVSPNPIVFFSSHTIFAMRFSRLWYIQLACDRIYHHSKRFFYIWLIL